ncbi:unnamed protein product, partial [Mesorhabditis belari]|uniref:Uncharacterized protein n=1 Tax=Mesorhabditis belari TaxID=2138241 RepID=A0AAF3ENN6_9BILA
MAPPMQQKLPGMEMKKSRDQRLVDQPKMQEEVVGHHMSTGEDVILKNGEPCLAKSGKIIPDKCVVYF